MLSGSRMTERRSRYGTRQELFRFARLPGGRLGRCFAEIDLTTVRGGVPVATKGGDADSSARPISSLIYGSSRSLVLCSRTFRTVLPLPRRIFFGSGSLAPLRKHSVTHFGINASE